MERETFANIYQSSKLEESGEYAMAYNKCRNAFRKAIFYCVKEQGVNPNTVKKVGLDIINSLLGDELIINKMGNLE